MSIDSAADHGIHRQAVFLGAAAALLLFSAQLRPALSQETPQSTPAPAAEQDAASSGEAAGPAAGAEGGLTVLSSDAFSPDLQDKPTYIKSDNLTLDSKARVFTYINEVEVHQADMALTCDTLQGDYDDNNRIKTMVASGNVVITKGLTIRATSQRAVYDTASRTVTLSESPELQESDSVLTAETVKIFMDDNRSVAEGDVRVKVVKSDKEKEEEGNQIGAQPKKKKRRKK